MVWYTSADANAIASPTTLLEAGLRASSIGQPVFQNPPLYRIRVAGSWIQRLAKNYHCLYYASDTF